MISRHFLLLGVVLSGLFAAPVVAAEKALPPIKGVPSAAKGKALSERWCKSCHLVEPGQTRAPNDMPPPFAVLARDIGKREAEYRGFLQVPHTPMTEISLSRLDIEDIIAYLHALAPKKAR